MRNKIRVRKCTQANLPFLTQIVSLGLWNKQRQSSFAERRRCREDAGRAIHHRGSGAKGHVSVRCKGASCHCCYLGSSQKLMFQPTAWTNIVEEISQIETDSSLKIKYKSEVLIVYGWHVGTEWKYLWKWTHTKVETLLHPWRSFTFTNFLNSIYILKTQRQFSLSICGWAGCRTHHRYQNLWMFKSMFSGKYACNIYNAYINLSSH